MSLNTITLARVIKELPEPTHRGQVLQRAFPARVTELNRHRPLDADLKPDAIAAHRIEFIAVEYAEGRHNRWLEWELIA